MASKPVILSGIRANGELTLGNYIGAIQPMVARQQQYGSTHAINFFVPDLHSFTTPIDHGTLYANTIGNLKLYVACGLDLAQENSYLYRQSYIPAHSELSWILSCFVWFGELQRMTQFKEKAAQQKQVSAGLFSYPVLMAADILLYDASYIPVGEDQRQHLELARDIAIRMNNQFKDDLFTVPKEWSEQLRFSDLDRGLRIRSLKHPDKKMSKSVSDPSGTILLNDDPEAAYRKVMGATTDSYGEIKYDWQERPGIANLLVMLSALSEQSLDQVLAEWEGQSSYGELKKTVAGLVRDRLDHIQQALNKVDESQLMTKLTHDETKLNNVANAKLLSVQKAVGLRG